MGLAFIYVGIGHWLEWRTEKSSAGVAPFALPFFAPGYLLSALALAVASGDKYLALYTFPAGVVLYALTAWIFREVIFLYPAAWLAAVPYYIGMTLTALAPEWRGIGWLPSIVFYVALGKLVFHKRALDASIFRPRTILPALLHPAMPFHLAGYTLSVHMLLLSQRDSLALTVAFAAGAALYLVSAVLFRRAAWLYPGLAALHLALIVAPSLYPTSQPAYYLSLPFLGITWLVALVGYGISRRAGVPPEKRSLVTYLVTSSWARPFFVVAFVDVMVWQVVALNGSATAIVLGMGYALLLALFACL